MNRRGFLKLLGIGAAAAVAPAIILPERKIWQVSRNAPVPSRFYGVRDILAESGGSLFGVDPGYSAKNFVWARWDDESKMLVVDEIDKADVLADSRRIGSQDLTFERPSEDQAAYWAEVDRSIERTVMGRTFPRIMAEWRGIHDMPEPSHAVLWTGITASKT